MIVPFGPKADAFARRLTQLDLEAIITDTEYLPNAILEAVDRRARGVPFYAMTLLEEPAWRFTLLNAARILEQIPGQDYRHAALTQLAGGEMRMPDGTRVADVWPASQEQAAILCGELYAVADAVLVRSQNEYARIVTITKRPRPFEPVLAPSEVPAVTRRRPRAPTVVIWAPERISQHVAFHAFALEEFHGSVTCVTSDGGAPAGLRAQFVRAADAAAVAALEEATCIVCVHPEDPADAVAFAAAGYGVAAPMSSGAHEYVRGLVPYAHGSPDALYAAVAIAIGAPAAVRQRPPDPPRVPQRAAPPVAPADLPLVTVVVPTYNRRADLARCLACLAAQTYPRTEIIVVNDAGEDVADVVARVPGARYLVMPQNGGVLETELLGIANATGDYIQLLADDDFLAPDHLEALMNAMLVSGASMAHGNCLIRHEEPLGGGDYATVGFNASVFTETATPTTALLATPVSGNSLLIHRRVFEAVGPYRADCMLADQEFQMRAQQRFAFAYVDRITAEWRARGKENFSTGADSVPELRRMYDELHPRPDRPDLERRRGEVLEGIARRPKGTFAFPPILSFRVRST